MINPCAVKGISIFLEVAARLPATTSAWCRDGAPPAGDRRALERLPNIQFLPNAPDIDDLLARTRVLLMPSLWYEGFGLIVMEAMLRGIPVVASDSGGLVEAKRGTGYVIPVAIIERYQPVFDEHAMPRPVVPPNDAAPWVAAIRELLEHCQAWRRESAASFARRRAFVDGLDAGAMERFLLDLEPRGAAALPALSVESLSPEKRALLLERLRRRRVAPDADSAGAELALLSGARRRRQIQPPADGGPGGRGHECRVVARLSTFGPQEQERYLEELAARSVAARAAGGVVAFERAGVSVEVVANANLRAHFAAWVEAFRPEAILVSTDDPAQLLLDVALRARGARVIYLARATLALPFGPDCAFPSESKTARLRAAGRVVGVSQYVADYVARHSGIPAVHVPISLLEPEDWPVLGRFENEFVTLVNPCAVKGIPIFLALADAFPDNALRGRAHVGHQPGRPRRTGRAPERHAARTGGRYQPAARAHARAAGAVAVGRGPLAHGAGSHAARRTGDGRQCGRHSRG